MATSSTAQTEALGEALGALLNAGDVVVLTGDLGAGKTHLAKGVARALGTSGTITSPTFNIALVHTGGRLVLNHLDLYRIDRADQLDDIDYFGTIESGGVTLVEWGDRFSEVLDLADLEVTLTVVDDDARSVAFRALSERGAALVSALTESAPRG